MPSLGEFVPGYNGTLWIALFAPRGLPPAVMSRLREGMQQAMADKDMRAQLQAQGVELAGTPERQVTPDELAAVLKQDIAKWAHIVKTSGATVN
ncbi:Tripartite tricarboxylate transporter family receptor [Comamonas thiooxydans]|nr:Tripartite tricarboxylate transporter family receptor [Comamonas thiooxydans]